MNASGPGYLGEEVVSVCNPLTQEDWDDALPRGEDTGAFHSQAWARVLHKAYGYTPLYLVADTGVWRRGVLPLMEVRSPITGARGVSLPFSDACPALAASEGTFATLCAKAIQLGRERGWRYVEWKGSNAPSADATPYVAYHGHRLDLTLGELALDQALSSSARRANRKAERSGVTVEFSDRTEAMLEYYELHCRTRRRHGVPPQPMRFFQLIQECLIRKGQGEIGLARHEGRLVAGAVFFRFGPVVHFKFGGADRSRQWLRASNLLLSRAIKRFANLGFKVFCFGRTDLEHEGLRRFKLGFGATEWPVTYYRMDLRTGHYSVGGCSAGGRAFGVFKWLPLWGGRLIGNMAYRHLG